MLTIRAAQMERMQNIALLRFENAMLSYIAQFFPAHLAIMPREAMRRVIRLGIGNARRHGLSSESDTCRYINLMLLFGSSFDQDFMLPWTRPLNGRPDASIAAADFDGLVGSAVAYFDSIAGAARASLHRALARLARDLPRLHALPVGGELRAHVAQLLGSLFPAKFALAPEGALDRLLQAGISTARKYDIATPQGTVVIMVIMFVAGHGFDEDPQHEWARRVLDDRAIGAIPERLDRLCRSAREHVDRWLETGR